MRIPSLGENDLLLPLHDGMFEQPMWQTFLSRLRLLTGADYAGLIIRPPGSLEEIHLWAGKALALPLRELLHEKFEPAPLHSRAMREGRVYSLEELVEGGGARARQCRDEILVPLGLKHMRSMRVREAEGVEAWLTISSRAELGAAVGNLLVALTPHLLVALRIFAALERERARSSMSADAFQRMNFGWISIDAACRIIDLDTQAERVLQRSGILRRGSYDRLMPSSPAADRELMSLARRFADNAEERPHAINLSRDPWIDILVAPLRVQTMAASGQPVAVVYLRGDRTSTADRCDQLVDLFALTPSEARLAWAMAQGLSIADCAAELGLTVETARNYSKKIYAKTGARGQSDLVRHILTSVLALA
jgi:hypothetical protein